MTKVLIMVLSYNVPPFSDFMRMQQKTWDAHQNPDVNTLYYYGDGSNQVLINTNHSAELQLACSDAYENMHWKFKLALDAVHRLQLEYTHIFRTNSCSYVRKDLLPAITESLPKTRCYAGWDNGKYISGAGIFLSPDVAHYLADNMPHTPHGAEDVLMGEMLATFAPPTPLAQDRWDAPPILGHIPTDRSHYRFKTSNDPADRYRDIKNMEILHTTLCQNARSLKPV